MRHVAVTDKNRDRKVSHDVNRIEICVDEKLEFTIKLGNYI